MGSCEQKLPCSVDWHVLPHKPATTGICIALAYGILINQRPERDHEFFFMLLIPLEDGQYWESD